MEAVDVLDEVGPAIPEQLIPITQCGAYHLCLSDTGELESEGFSESLQAIISERAYPILDELGNAEAFGVVEGTDEQKREAVAKERERVRYGPDLAKTPKGREIQATMGLSGALADDWALRYGKPESDKEQ